MKAALEPYIPAARRIGGGISVQALGNSRERKPIGPSVAATVQRGLGRAGPHHDPGATDQHGLNAQSPSHRSDGDCGLRLGTPVASVR